jgi:hypothetical protein
MKASGIRQAIRPPTACPARTPRLQSVFSGNLPKRACVDSLRAPGQGPLPIAVDPMERYTLTAHQAEQVSCRVSTGSHQSAAEEPWCGGRYLTIPEGLPSWAS